MKKLEGLISYFVVFFFRNYHTCNKQKIILCELRFNPREGRLKIEKLSKLGTLKWNFEKL